MYIGTYTIYIIYYIPSKKTGKNRRRRIQIIIFIFLSYIFISIYSILIFGPYQCVILNYL